MHIRDSTGDGKTTRTAVTIDFKEPKYNDNHDDGKYTSVNEDAQVVIGTAPHTYILDMFKW